MIGGRVLSSVARWGGSPLSTWKPIATQKSCLTSSFTSVPRALSSHKMQSSEPAAKKPQIPSAFSNMNLINRRFFQNASDSSTSWSSMTSKVFAVFGALLGIGSGGAYSAYNSMKDKDPILANYDLVVSCADKCGCDKTKNSDTEKGCIEKTKCGETKCLRDVVCEEELVRKANSDLEHALKDTRDKAFEYTEAAMKAYCAAVPLVCKYLNHGYGTLGNDELESPEYEETWCCIYDTAKKRCAAVKEAMEKGQCAWELLCRLRDVIEKGRACKFTSCNPLLGTAEDSLACAERELLNEKAKMDWAQSEHDMVDQYKDLIENYKKELKATVEAKIAAGGMKCCDIKHPEQVMSLMIATAYQQVVRTQKEVAQVLVCSGRVPERQAKTCC